MILGAQYQCGYCFAWNDTSVDVSSGSNQQYVEDCQVCCRPNVLSIYVDAESGEVQVLAEFEG